MELDNYTNLAIRTEKQIDVVNVNRDHLHNLLSAYIEIGNVLDTIKKNVYYNKPYDVQVQDERIIRAIDALTALVDTRFTTNPSPLQINPRIFHAIVGVATESTELVEALYKAEYKGAELDVVNLTEEAADAMWYLAILHDEVSIPISDSLQRNINKLKIRFPDKFTDANALTRDIDSERVELSRTV